MATVNRNLSNDFMSALKNGELTGFLKAVKEDDTLCFEIRRNYINIYYRGGNLCRIKMKSAKYVFEFDEKYTKNKDANIVKKNKEIIKNIETWDKVQWINNIPLLKLIMDAYKLPPEREFQQLVLRENNNSKICNDTDYYIADVEYLFNYGNKKTRRSIDMVAIKWPSTIISRKNKDNLQLALIEVKYGDSALNKTSGIIEHVKDWYKLISDKNKWNFLCEDAEKVFNQKIELGLIRGIKNKTMTISTKKMPELILLIINTKPQKTTLNTELQKINTLDEYKVLRNLGCEEIKIATASMMGYGLYIECIKPINEFLGE